MSLVLKVKNVMATGRTVRQVKQGERLRRIQGALNQSVVNGKRLSPEGGNESDIGATVGRLIQFFCGTVNTSLVTASK